MFCLSHRYNADVKSSSSPTNSYENVILDQMTSEEKAHQVFMERPFCEYSGHTSDLLDVSWSKNYFILTSSMDKTVRLWHISRYQNQNFIFKPVFFSWLYYWLVPGLYMLGVWNRKNYFEITAFLNFKTGKAGISKLLIIIPVFL